MSAVFEAVQSIANACQLLPTVVTGGQPTAANLEAFKAAGGAVVLDLREPMEPRTIDEPALVNRLGMDYVNVPVGAGGMSDETIDRVLDVLRGAEDRAVLVHCTSGNRVAGVLLPYLILDQALNEEDAINQAMRVGLRSAELLEWGLDYARRHHPPTVG
ncbi:MAG TPA: sulfur transferase domain-containing protein [Gemmatimonadales bacterium]